MPSRKTKKHSRTTTSSGGRSGRSTKARGSASKSKASTGNPGPTPGRKPPPKRAKARAGRKPSGVEILPVPSGYLSHVADKLNHIIKAMDPWHPDDQEIVHDLYKVFAKVSFEAERRRTSGA